MSTAAVRQVDTAHVIASRQPDPVAYMRDRQAEAEQRFARTGRAADLAVVLAYEASLDGEPEGWGQP